MRIRAAFTIIEVLIAIALMGIILPVLYRSTDVLNDSNRQLRRYLEQSEYDKRVAHALFLDIAASDGNLSIKKDDFDRLCMERTHNSLYGRAEAKVCWVVTKEDHILIRTEGTDYHLPVKDGEQIDTDAVSRDIVHFDVTYVKDKVLVVLQQKDKKPDAFLVQGITKPTPPKPKPIPPRRKKQANPPVRLQKKAPPKPSSFPGL